MSEINKLSVIPEFMTVNHHSIAICYKLDYQRINFEDSTMWSRKFQEWIPFDEAHLINWRGLCALNADNVSCVSCPPDENCPFDQATERPYRPSFYNL